MIQRITENDEGNTMIEVDWEGAEYLIEGLRVLREGLPGALLSTPAVWTEPAPWWRFWNRKGTPVVGEFLLRLVE